MAATSSTSEDAREVPPMSAVEIQQQFYEAMGDADWELYEMKERKHLLQKIAVALYGPPTIEGNLMNVNDKLSLQGYGPREQDSTINVFKKICEQAKYSHNGQNILISILRVVFVAPTKEVPIYKLEPADYWVDLHLKKAKEDVTIAVFHVFCLRKCIALKSGVKGCKVYIDHDARVYKDWNSYLTENKLPKGVLVVPENGEYKGAIDRNISRLMDGNLGMPQVKYSVVPSPALGLGARVLSIADTTSTVASIGALVGVIGVLAIPAAAPVAGTVVAVGAATSVYGIIRSSIHLADRNKHEQDIGFGSSEARSSWINILVSSVGLSFSAAGKLLAWAAASGSNIKILINALQFLRYSTIASGLIGVVNNIGDMIHKYTKYNEKPTGLELFQFTTSLLFFGIGVMSNQTAQEIVQDAQAKTINEVRDSLTSNAKRKMFDKVTAETRRLQGTIEGNAEVIRGLKTIENKNQFFAQLSKMNKQMNQNKLRVSLTADGKPLINNQFKVTVSELKGLGKQGRSDLFSSYGPAKVTTKNVPTRIYPSYVAARSSDSSNSGNNPCNIRPEEMIKIASFLITLNAREKDFVDLLLSEFSQDFHDAFLLICVDVLASFVPSEIDEFINTFGVDYKRRIILFLFNFIRTRVSQCDYENDSGIIIVLKELLHHGRVEAKTIGLLRSRVKKWLNERKNGKIIEFDPKIYDCLYTLQKSREYLTLKAGEVIEIGEHEILIKNSTTEKLEEWLAVHSQQRCDMFIQFNLKIVSLLSKQEVVKLNLVNPDEDIVLRVADFIVSWNDVEVLMEILEEGSMDIVAGDFKNDLITYWSQQKLRKYEKCSSCGGIKYTI